MSRAVVVLLCVLASAAHASSLDGNYADEQAQRRLSYERVYTYYPELKSWPNARETCTDYGGHLATVRSEAENIKISALHQGVDAWIGYTATQQYSPQEGVVWVWEEYGENQGNPATAHIVKWGTAQPDNAAGNENCALLMADGTWRDADGGLQTDVDGVGSPFICQTDVTYAPTYTPMPSREPIPAPSSMPTAAPVAQSYDYSSHSYDDPETFDCYIDECGCPGAFLKDWCSADTAMITAPWCGESASNCETCTGTACFEHVNPVVTTPMTPTATPESKECYINQCGCPGSFLHSWCSEHTAKITSPWCNEGEGHCGMCSGSYCAMNDDITPPPVPTGECFISQCGCPGNFAQEWCTEASAKITSPWCNDNDSNCGTCSGHYCPVSA